MAPPPSRRRIAFYVVLGVLALAAILLLLVRRRGTVLEAGFRGLLIDEVTSATDSVYQLSIANLHLSLFPGRISIDSVRLVTDTARNDFRADPYPVLTATASGCRISGIGTWGLLTGQGVTARLFRCDEIRAEVLEVIRDHPKTESAATADPRGGIPFLRDSLQLPALLPRIVVHHTQLPRVTLDYTRRSRTGAETHVTLERLAIALTETRMDPAISPKARKPLFSDQAVVTADTLQVLGSKQQSIVLGRMHLNLTDSTLGIDSIVVGPRQSDAAWVKEQKQRKDLIRISLDSVRVRGVDYRRLLNTEGAIVARQSMLHGLEIRVLTDKRLPTSGLRRSRRSPQQVIADLERPLLMDSVTIVSGRIAYSEHGEGKPEAGTMTWEKLHAQITHLKTVPAGSKVVPPPLTIHASALLLGKGKLEATFEIPLGAQRFDMKYSGSLGPMDMTVLNPFITRLYSAKVASGAIESIRFAVVVRGGRSTGQVTPVYHDFKIALEDKKGGFLKKAGLSIVTVFANAFKVRANNPGKTGEKPLVGPVVYPYHPWESLPQMFWFALRGGLGKVFVK